METPDERRIAAIFLDVDGTLVSFRTHAVSPSAREALRKAHARGVRLYIATGRAAGDLEPLAGIPYDGVVALNGARCVAADGRVVGSSPIPQADFERSLALAAQFGFPVALELDDGVFVDRVTPEVERLAHMVAHPVPVQTDLKALFARGDCCQMCFYFDEQTQQRVMASLPGLTASRWCDLFADINAAGIDKATGMRVFCADAGFGLSQTMAFGDGGNDVAMLRAAGIGVAMGNACAEALAAADYVTADIDDDGLRRALEHFAVI